jgi:rhamnose transport system ATP-binding protein
MVRNDFVTQMPVIQLQNISRSFGGIQAISDLTLEISAGEVHAICGENGAGKSTLIKLLAGVHRADSGRILVAGSLLNTGRVHDSEAAGIAVMHQESTAFPDLNAVENLFVGREHTRLGGLLLDKASMRARTAQLFAHLGVQVPLHIPVGQLPLAQRQMVALARALSRECRLLIMDEPTASLSARETQTLLRIVRQLRSQGVSVLYVSHRMEEIFAVSDRVSVLRDGKLVGTRITSEVNSDELIRMMAGRELPDLNSRTHGAALTGFSVPGPVVLQADCLTAAGFFRDISFSVREGEIVGLTGLVGAGRSEIVRAIFGVDQYDSGSVTVDGQPLPCGSISDAMQAGLALVPEDRQHEGLILPMTVSQNVSLASLNSLTYCGLLNAAKESELVSRQLSDLSVKTSSPAAVASTLSGGNQQKLVLGKWMARQPRVLILDEPSRGVDVGAKFQLHHLIREAAANKLATLVVSSDLTELLTLSDRIIVIRQGEIAGELSREEATAERILAMSLPERKSGDPIDSPSSATELSSGPSNVSRPHSSLKWMAKIFRQREAGLLMLIAMTVVLAGTADSVFLSPSVWKDILVRAAPTAIVCCGVMLVVVCGEIDISSGSLMAMLAAVLGLTISEDHAQFPLWPGVSMIPVLGAAIGLITGCIVTFGKVPSIIATLGLMTALRGCTMLMMGGQNITGLPDQLSVLAKRGPLGFPAGIWIAGFMVLFTDYLIRGTPLGLRIYALGSSPQAARTAGISGVRIRLFVFAWTGFLVGLATLAEVPRLPKIESGIGVEFELLVVTCVVVGGVSVSGGKGNLAGVMLAVLLMTMLRPVLTFLDIGEAAEKWTKAIQGLFILLAVTADTLLNATSRRRRH